MRESGTGGSPTAPNSAASQTGWSRDQLSSCAILRILGKQWSQAEGSQSRKTCDRPQESNIRFHSDISS
jgi:hypothetical protein